MVMTVAARVLAPLIAILITGESAIGSLNVAVMSSEVPDFTGPAGEYVIAAVGAVLSTVNVVLGPAAGAVFPAVSVAVPAAMEIPRVPSPVMLESVTVRVVPEPLTPIVALAVPVLFKVMLPGASVLELKLVSAYVTV